MLRSLQKTIGKWARPCLSHCYLGATSSTRCWCGIVTHGLLTSELGPVLHDWGGLSGQGPHAGQGGISLANAAPRLSYTARTGPPRGWLEPNDGSSWLHEDKAPPSWSDWHEAIGDSFPHLSLSPLLLCARGAAAKHCVILCSPTSSSVVPRLALTCSLTCRTLTHTARAARMSPRISPGRHPAMLAVGERKVYAT